MTFSAWEAIKKANYIVGYKTYINLIKDMLTDQQKVVSTGMRGEVERCQTAIRLARAGEIVAVISSGDAGVYGMAGLIYQLLFQDNISLQVTVIPGITASIAAASLLGAPLMHDHCSISLSDLLTPWEVITKRIEAAAQADFVIAFYNPRSRERTEHIEKAREILLKYRPPSTPVGIVKNAFRTDQHITVSNLEEFTNCEIDMLSVVIVGNSQSFIKDGKIITPRGYDL
ncbi:precorrin-3B C17-methyltransferase [Carboxydocella sporoproducens DSM 16521]|uniref:Precorrin-3B C17-methyltransferase n=2 Tax=Carboxydocella TaxID=178898 RepID=A0A1T4LS64_9FIRM|nr:MULTISPECIES: precorrin-3B C(17)-methyltransferase [Carboxydocella]AVX20586.1 cobalt-precorrin 3 C17-methyltransferase [Carboxydocella thermautotrophica]AVX31008.1 cobalt-precorrin 3 C17-methyltransferase [Carboxydocella thermautotrophica]SJZ57456.1 precorrin-3B C17-methyltransferase [Carboxydocella sporoproducens DSM 16521]